MLVKSRNRRHIWKPVGLKVAAKALRKAKALATASGDGPIGACTPLDHVFAPVGGMVMVPDSVTNPLDNVHGSGKPELTPRRRSAEPLRTKLTRSSLRKAQFNDSVIHYAKSTKF